jgi:hypothetical protein
MAKPLYYKGPRSSGLSPQRAPQHRVRSDEDRDRSWWRERTARHEAGHAIGFLAAGCEVPRVYFTSDGGGFCEAKGRGAEKTYGKLVATLCGPATDELFESAVDIGETPDDVQANYLACLIDKGRYGHVRNKARLHASAIVSKYRPQIERLAEALLERDEVSGAEIAEIVGPIPRLSCRYTSPDDNFFRRPGVMAASLEGAMSRSARPATMPMPAEVPQMPEAFAEWLWRKPIKMPYETWCRKNPFRA